MTGLVQTPSEETRPRSSSPWLLVDLSSLPDGRSISYSGGCLSVFWYTVFITLHACVIIVRPLHFIWLLVLGLCKEDYLQMFKCVSFWLHGFCGYWEGWDPVHRFKHTSWVAVVAPTDRPKSVRNRCVIEVFGGVCVLSRFLFYFFSVGVWGFCHRTESDLFPFLLFTVSQVLKLDLYDLNN